MKIAVCFKIVPDFEDVHSTEWETLGGLDFTYIKKVYGCFDEAALETGLRIADQLKAAGQPVETVAVTCGAPGGSVSEGLLRALFAAGYNDVALLPAAPDFAPAVVAETLADYLVKNPADLVLTGRMVGPGDSGMVPVYLAEKLGAEFYPELVTARWDEAAGKITLTCDEGDFLRTYEPGGKALCSLGDGEAGYLRLFPLKARMEAKKREFIRVEEDCVNAETQADVILRTEKIDNNCNFIEYRSAEETAQMLVNIMKGETGHEG